MTERHIAMLKATAKTFLGSVLSTLVSISEE